MGLLRPLLVGAALLGAALSALPPSPAAAQEASVRLDGGRVVVDAREASVEAVLEQLAGVTGVVLERLDDALLAGSLSGSRRGSLEQVLGWVLRGQSYVLVYSPVTARVERVVVGIAPPSGEGEAPGVLRPPTRKSPFDDDDDPYWDDEDDDWDGASSQRRRPEASAPSLAARPRAGGRR